jgi:hypothetical protein
MNKTIRVFAVAASVSLLVGALVGPADAKKKKKPKPIPAGCATFVAENPNGKDLPTTIVTDAATAEAPVVVELETAMGVGATSPSAEDPPENGMPSHAYTNVQVDSALSAVGLYVTVEFSPQWDYDLLLRTAAPEAVAYSAGGAPYVGPFDGTGHGGHAAEGSENIDGIDTADCAGYTVDVVSATTPGETVTLKYWLGESAYTPGT